MKKKIIISILGITFLVVGILIGRAVMPTSQEITRYIPKLKIIGDVEEVAVIHDMNLLKSEDEKLTGGTIGLKKLIDLAKPAAESYDVLLVGDDGIFAQLEDKNLDDCSINFSEVNGWESVTNNHPINSRIKRIKEIVVISRNKSWDYGFNIISPKENILNITPGELYLMELNLYPYFDGKSTKSVDGRNYDVKLYKQRRLLPIKSIIDSNNKPLLMMGSNGVYEMIDNSGYLELMGNAINYVNLEKRKQLQGIKGIMIDVPSDSIMDVYYDALHYIENDEDVLIIFLDGFGYHQYQYALSKGYIPFLESIAPPKSAMSVYKPVTNAGFAAMITGQPPYINGVYDRKYKDLKAESIFGAVEKMGKKAVLIEGDIKILNTEIEPSLNIDKNKNGTRDDEIFDASLKEIENKPDLALVHFHSIDDMGHEHGDLSDETMETLEKIDGYVKGLTRKWKGKIIITADHGMHKAAEGGDHGAFRHEDLIVPYFVIK